MRMKDYPIKTEGRFRYYEEGEGETLLLLHGLFGALSNFHAVIDHFSPKMKVVLPLLPLYELPVEETGLIGMVDYVTKFIDHKGYNKVILLGNSLGGHIALLYTLQNLKKVNALVLTGSSGLFEKSLGDSYPKKGDYDYVQTKTEATFYDPKVATKALVDDVFDIVNDREKAIRILYLARSAMKHNLKEELGKLTLPCLLIWGAEDPITPPWAAEEFHKLLPESELHFIEKCGHAPMMERPKEFDSLLDTFLEQLLVL